MNLKADLQYFGLALLAKLEVQQKLLEEMNAKIDNFGKPAVPESTTPPPTVHHVCDCTKTDQEVENLRAEVEKLRFDLTTLQSTLKTKQEELDAQRLNFDNQLLALKEEINPLKFQVTMMEEDWQKKTIVLIRTAFEETTTKLQPTTGNFHKIYRKLKRDRESTGVDIRRRNKYLIDMLEYCEHRFSKDVNDYKVHEAGKVEFDREYLNPEGELGLAYAKFVIALLKHRSTISDDFIPAEEFWGNW
jgi:chromosome segregation ATPase